MTSSQKECRFHGEVFIVNNLIAVARHANNSPYYRHERWVAHALTPGEVCAAAPVALSGLQLKITFISVSLEQLFLK